MAIERLPDSRFRYGADGVFRAAVGLYLLNKLWLRHTSFGRTGFFHDHFNDSLLIPFFLPAVLWVHRRLGLRRHDRPPTVSEVTLHVVLWSLCFEWLFARYHVLSQHSTADPKDALAYAAGGAVAWCLWRIPRRFGAAIRTSGDSEVGRGACGAGDTSRSLSLPPARPRKMGVREPLSQARLAAGLQRPATCRR